MNGPMTDRRLLPATERVALATLRGKIERPAYTPGHPMRVTAAVADLCRTPGGARDRQAVFGTDVILIDETAGFSFIQSSLDGYCGWLRSDALGSDRPPISHRVCAPATHIYSQPDMKQPEIMGLSLGARLSVLAVQNGFARLTSGGWVPQQHISEQPETDPATVATKLIGTPYLWGGNSRWGIDCSGLAQAALTSCAVTCPGDSDMQEQAFAKVSDEFQRGDLLFWPGHVAMALDARQMIHATAFAMAVIVEPITQAMARIDAAGQGPFRGARRPSLVAAGQFP